MDEVLLTKPVIDDIEAAGYKVLTRKEWVVLQRAIEAANTVISNGGMMTDGNFGVDPPDIAKLAEALRHAGLSVREWDT